MVASRSTFGAPSSAGGSSLTAGESSGGSSFGPAEAATASDLAVTETDKGTLVTLSGDVLFDFDKSEIRADARPVLKQLANLIAKDTPAKIEISGHTDSKGSDAYNQSLSERRAGSARDYLADNFALDAALFRVIGRGADAPVAQNERPDGSDDPEGRQRNRRVEVLLAD